MHKFCACYKRFLARLSVLPCCSDVKVFLASIQCVAGAVWITYSTTKALGVGSGAPGLDKRGWEPLLNHVKSYELSY